MNSTRNPSLKSGKNEETESLLADFQEEVDAKKESGTESNYDDFVKHQPPSEKKEQPEDLLHLESNQKKQYPGAQQIEAIYNYDAHLTFNALVQVSPYKDLKNEQKVKKIVTDFNQGNSQSFVKEISQASSTFGFSGRRIARDEFWLVKRGGEFQLVPFSQKLVRTKRYPFDVSVDDLGVHKQNSLILGENGRFVINVPPGKLLKAWEDNNTPIFLGEGSHLIKNPNFRLEAPDNNPNASLVNISELYIRHGNYHVVRVPQGKLLKIWINNEAHLLGPQAQPYVFNDPTFRLDTVEPNASLVNISELYIRHNNRHIVRVPQGKLLKIWINNEACLLEPRVEPYTFNDPTFRLDTGDIQSSLVSILDPYIQHGNRHILRIPYGKVVKAWFGSIPKFLEAQDEPYMYDDPTFKVDFNTKGMDGRDIPKTPFFDAATSYMEHGNLKWIRTPDGFNAITYNNGVREIYEPNPKPVIIDSPFHIFDRFFDTKRQTLLLPTDDAKRARIKELGGKENKDDFDSINYEQFTTSDWLSVNVKLLVIYRVSEPAKALLFLKPEEIVNHVETIVVADMRQTIQSHSSADFQNANLKRASTTDDQPKEKGMAAPPTLQEEIQNRLKDHLKEAGIELLRVNIESLHLDKTTAEKMSASSKNTMEIRGYLSAADQQFQLDITKAENAQRVNQQNNLNILAQKAAELQQAEADLKTQQVKNEQTYQQKLLDVRLASEQTKQKSQAEAEALKIAAQIKQQTQALTNQQTVMQKKSELAQVKIEAEVQKVRNELLYQQELRKIQLAQDKNKLEAKTQADILKTQTDAQNDTSQKKAETNADIAVTNADAELEVAKRKAEMDRLKIDNEMYKLRKKGEVYDEHPVLAQIEMVDIVSKRLEGVKTSVISPEVVGNFLLSPPGLFNQQGMFGAASRTNPTALPQQNMLAALTASATSSINQALKEAEILEENKETTSSKPMADIVRLMPSPKVDRKVEGTVEKTAEIVENRKIGLNG